MGKLQNKRNLKIRSITMKISLSFSFLMMGNLQTTSDYFNGSAKQ